MLSWKDELMHYGVKGMRWGVRKERSRSKVNSIFSTMSGKEKYYLVDDEHAKEYATKEMYDRHASTLAASYIKSIDNKPVAFLDVYNNSGIGDIAIGVDARYRGQGNAKALVSRLLSDIKDIPISELRWNVHPENISSIRLAESSGFVKDPQGSTDKVTSLRYKKNR